MATAAAAWDGPEDSDGYTTRTTLKSSIDNMVSRHSGDVSAVYAAAAARSCRPPHEPGLAHDAYATATTITASRLFRLDDAFVDSYREREAPFGFNGLGKFVYMRTYSRVKAPRRRGSRRCGASSRAPTACRKSGYAATGSGGTGARRSGARARCTTACSR
jgi:hypothetical protein